MLGAIAPVRRSSRRTIPPQAMDALLEALLGLVWQLLSGLAEVVFDALVEPLLGILLHLLWTVACWVVAIPVCYAVYTPVLLVRSLFGAGTYAGKVADGYREMTAALPQIADWL